MARLPAGARIGAVELRVTDVDRSLAFYTEVIGLAVLRREGGRAEIGPAGGRTLLRLEGDARATPRPRGTSGLFHVAILVPDRVALGRALGRIAAARWPLSGAADHLVSEALYLSDPDHLGLEIYRDRPPDSWPIDGDEVLMATDPLDLDAVAAEPGAEVPAPMPAETVVGHVHLTVPSLDGAERLSATTSGLRRRCGDTPAPCSSPPAVTHHHVGLNVWAGRGAPPPPPDAVGSAPSPSKPRAWRRAWSTTRRRASTCASARPRETVVRAKGHLSIAVLLMTACLPAAPAARVESRAARSRPLAHRGGTTRAAGDDDGAIEALMGDDVEAGCPERELARLSLEDGAKRVGSRSAREIPAGWGLFASGSRACPPSASRAMPTGAGRDLADALIRAAVAAAQDERDEMSLYLTHARGLAARCGWRRARPAGRCRWIWRGGSGSRWIATPRRVRRSTAR